MHDHLSHVSCIYGNYPVMLGYAVLSTYKPVASTCQLTVTLSTLVGDLAFETSFLDK